MRKSYRFCLILLALFSFNNFAFSQKDFRQGYIINNNLDTVYGWLNNRSNSINSLKCEFKKTEKAEVEVFYPLDIHAYVLANNRHYVSKTINFKGVEKSVFLEYLVDGILDLYYYNEGLEEYFYVEKEGDLIQLDNNEIEVVDENEVKHLRYSNQYKGVLKKLFGDVTELDWQIINSKFEFGSLINLTKEYHRMVCTDEVCIDYSKVRKFDIFCELVSGVDFSYMGLASSHDYAQDVQPLVGLNIYFKDNRYNSKFNFKTGFTISKHTYSGGFRNTLVYNNRTMSHGVNLNCNLLRIPITLEYEPLQGKFRPIVTATLSNSFLLNAEYNVEIRNYTVSGGYNVITTESPLRKYQYGIMLGAGFSYELNANSYLNFSINGEYSVPYRNINLILDRLHFTSMPIQIAYGFRIH
jgi:hypothetical protein